ncbi:MAG: ParB/RepB/Spo0J family partition protein [Oscillospiraceae bacterium]|nr:ParB/RepB/Spo0J family partition protein [Oscillospiraceae bacterium]
MAKPKKSGLGKGLDALFLDNAQDEAEENGSFSVRISEIEPNRRQPRKDFNETALAELADSIREHGILQPLLVRKLETGGYQLVAGERRWRAARMIGLDEVPVIVRDMTEAEVMELGLIENLQREDLNPLEEAAGYQELMTTYGLTQEQVAKRVGKSRSAVANALRVLNLPEQVRPLISSGQLSMGHAKALLGLDNTEELIKLAQLAAEKGLSVREVERLVSKLKAAAGSPPEGEKVMDELSRFYQEMQLAMNEELGRKVKISGRADGKGVLEIAFYGKEDLASIAERLANLQ